MLFFSHGGAITLIKCFGRGTADCIRHAQQLIDDLIDNDQSQPSVNIGNSNQNSSQATERKSPKQSTATLIAPIPTRPAWVVPPSIVRNKKVIWKAGATNDRTVCWWLDWYESGHPKALFSFELLIWLLKIAWNRLKEVTQPLIIARNRLKGVT